MIVNARTCVYAATIIAVCVVGFAVTSVSARSTVDPRSLIALDAAGNVQADVAAAVSGKKCTYGGVMGVCQSSTCAGKTYTGLCSGSATVTCCIPSSSTTTSPSVQDASAGGSAQTTLQRLSETEHKAKFVRFNAVNKKTYATAALKQAAYSIFRLNRVKIIYLNDRYGAGRTPFSSSSPYTATTVEEFARTKLGSKNPAVKADGSFIEMEPFEPAAAQAEHDPHWAVFQDMAARSDADEADSALDAEFLESDAESEVDTDSDSAAFLPAMGEVCIANGQTGLCDYEAGCNGRKGTSFAQLCAGASHIKCCVASTEPTPTPTPTNTPADTWIVDYRAHMQPVRDQGQCGSCWAFAANAVMEYGAKKIGLGQSPHAPQWVHDCDDYASQGANCRGGVSSYALFSAQKHQPALESEYPYLATSTACLMADGHSGVVVKATGHDKQCSGYGENESCDDVDEKALLDTLKNRGPLAVAIHSGNWQFFRGGELFPSSSCSHAWNAANHAVVLVGYGVDGRTGKNFWLIRNSWSSAWGEDGYIRLEANLSKGSSCGVANNPYWATMKKA